MDNYLGVIIGESLDSQAILKKVKIVSTIVEGVTDKHQIPWLKQWTLQTVEAPEDQAKSVAEEISQSLDRKHAWYADFKNSTHHYIIFRNKIFFVYRHSQDQYNEAKKYGVALGIPEYQVDFHPDIKKWER